MQKILIVEDDERIRDELEIFLKNNGYQAESLKSFENTSSGTSSHINLSSLL